jgi:phenylalanyl-tRNA synthetase beta chain
MKISSNWLRELTGTDKKPHEIADILTSLGLEVEGMKEVKSSEVDLDRVVTAHVVACAPIPDTDHLSATMVDTGDGQVRSVVCGAPNIALGQKVLVALPGARVFSKDGQLFAIGERKVRGVMSSGMVCAEDELGIGRDHSGIMVLPEDTPLGVSAAAFLKLSGDVVFEIGLTPNRADATSHVGVARDFLAWVRAHEREDAGLLRPPVADLTVPISAEAGSIIRVEVADHAACPRYAGVTIRGVRVGESPDWLKDRLMALGQRPINSVVDITNYIRLESGQPLHAFDASKIGGGVVRVRTLPEGTVFIGLDGVERSLSPEDLVVCDGNDYPMCMAGVFGGLETGVSFGTTDVFLESAVFDSRWIRRTMLRHGLRTDAAWCFEKGVDPTGTTDALSRAVQMVLDISGGSISSPVWDNYPTPGAPVRIEVVFDGVRALSGVDFSAQTILRILRALEIQVEAASADRCIVLAPSNKPDVLRPADVVEEILRVYGLDNIPVPPSGRFSPEEKQRPDLESVQQVAADFLASNGFMECMSLSLDNTSWYTGPSAMLPLSEHALVKVHNTANQGLDCMRPTLLFGGMEAIRHNQNRQHPDLRLFELGRTFRRDGSLFVEERHAGIWMTGARQSGSWHASAKKSVDFYTLKSYVQNLLARLGVVGYQETAVQEAPFQYALRYHRGDQVLAVLGAVLPGISKRMEIRQPVYFADLHMDRVFAAAVRNSIIYRELGRYPFVQRDLALVLDRNVSFSDIRQLASKTLRHLLSDVQLFDVFEDANRLGADKKSYAIRFTFEDKDKTLQDKEIDAAMQALQAAFQDKLHALVRQ